MDVRTAVAKAKEWLAEVMEEEGITNVGLEEVEFDRDHNVWQITLGFSRPWNSVRNAFTAISGEPVPRRSFRVITVKEPNGEVISMARRRETDD